jgi:hypothetical protein
VGLLAASLLAELKKVDPQVHFVVQITTDAGTALLSGEPVASTSLGHYNPWITAWGTLTRSLSNFRGGIQAPTFGFTVDDTGGQFTGTYGLRLRGDAVVVKLLSPNVTAASYFTLFSGVVDAVRRRGSKLEISCRQDDDALTQPLTKARITKYAFPDLPLSGTAPASDSAIPWLVGVHDSAPFSGTGMVPCLYVDSVNFRYLVGLTWDLTVTRVFSNGTIKAEPADYSVVQTFAADGRKITLLDFVADQTTNEIVADVSESVSTDGPCNRLENLLVNLAWNDYHISSAATSTEPIASTVMDSTDALLVTALGHGRAYYLPPERKTGLDVIKALCDSYEVHGYWTYDGKLAVAPWEIRTQNDSIYRGTGSPDTTLAAALHLTEADQLSDPEIAQDAESSLSRVTGKAGLRSADNTYLNQRTVLVDAGEGERALDVNMDWLVASQESIGAVTYLYPDSDAATSGTAITGAATVYQAVDDPQGSPDYNTTYVESNSGVVDMSFRLGLGAMPDLVSVSSVEIIYVAKGSGTVAGGDDDDIKPYLYVSAAIYYGTTVTGISTGWRVINGGTWTTNPATSAAWTQSDLNSLQAGLEWYQATSGVKKLRVTQFYVKVNYSAAAGAPPATLEVISRKLNHYRRAPNAYTVEAPLKFLDLELGTDVPVVRRDMGWDERIWARRLHRVQSIKLSPGNKRLTLGLEDVQPQLTTFWLYGAAGVGVDGSSSAGDGMALVTHGGTVTTARTSVKNLDSPAGVGIQSAGPVVQVNANCWPSERYGCLIEAAETNELVRSSFVSGTTGLTISAGSGSAAADTTVADQLFVQSTVTGNVLLLTAGNPHVTETRVTWPATASITANTIVFVSIDRKGSSSTASDGLSWRLVRSVGATTYWNDTTSAWVAGATDNALSDVTSWTRAVSKPIDVGASNVTLTLSVSLPSGGTASRTVHVGHVQLEQNSWASSRIVTNAATVTRSADAITIGNDKSDGTTTYYAWPNTRGSFVAAVVPNWTAGHLPASQIHTIARLSYDANNWFRLYYQQGTGFVFEVRAAGSTYTASASTTATVVRDRQVDVAVRWGSSSAELGETAGTATLLVRDINGVVNSSSIVFGTAPTFAAGKNLELGHDAGTSGREWDGYIVEARVSPFVWSDSEIWSLLS